MFAVATTYALAHHFRLSGGVIGAYYNKWGMKRHTVRYGPVKSGRSFILPSNSYLLTMFAIGLTIILLATVGPDHPSADKGIFQYKRAWDQMMTEINDVNITKSVEHEHVNKSLWSAGNRFGFMAFACMPLIVLMALKSGPFGLFTLPFFTSLHWDKIGSFHRAGGWLVWWLVTIHVILWTNQLFKDHYDGRAMWFGMLIATRFRSAIFAYFCMTAAMFTSLRWIRNRVYELFYLSHVVFIFLALVFAIIHHSVIWYWVGASLILWGGDRVTRWIRSAMINGVFGTKEIKSENPFLDKYNEHAEAAPPEVPPGYAQAQILPSKTVRLSIRTHRPMKWQPGQSLLLNLPELSTLQTHPFSISNNNPNEIVLLIKARKGLTLDLYDLVLERTKKALKPSDKRLSILPRSAPVHVKARVDGPMGSAGRVPWTEYSNVLIVCGGSGVTFGLAIGDFLSRVMSRPDFAGATRRVRFVWIVREYAEITWAASVLCRFRALLSKAQLEINIYVTNGEKSKALDRTRMSTIDEDISDDESDGRSTAEPGFTSFTPAHNPGDIDPETGLDYDEDVRQLTNYGQEEDNNDPKDKRLSRIFQEEGKLRRARSRQSAIYGDTLEPVLPPSDELMPANAARRVSDIKLADAKRASDIKLQEISRKHDWNTLSPAMALAPLQMPGSHPGQLSPIPGSAYSTPYTSYPSSHLPRVDSETTLRNSDRFGPSSAVSERFNPYKTAAGVDPYTPLTPTPQSSVDALNYKAYHSRTQDMILLEDTPDAKGSSCASCGHCEGASLWIDDGDYTAAKMMSECARSGRPPLQSILNEEMRNASGQTIIATCGPVGLNTTLRNLVSTSIDTAKIRRGDSSGYVTMYSEDFEM